MGNDSSKDSNDKDSSNIEGRYVRDNYGVSDYPCSKDYSNYPDTYSGNDYPEYPQGNDKDHKDENFNIMEYKSQFSDTSSVGDQKYNSHPNLPGSIITRTQTPDEKLRDIEKQMRLDVAKCTSNYELISEEISTCLYKAATKH